MNGEKFICHDTRLTENIDGVEYLLVHRPDNNRQFLMRKDILEKVNTAVVKGISRDPAKV